MPLTSCFSSFDRAACSDLIHQFTFPQTLNISSSYKSIQLPRFNLLSFIRCTSSILFCLCVFVPLAIQVLWDNMTPYWLASWQLRVLTSLQGVKSETTSVFTDSAERISDFVFVFQCIHKRNLGWGQMPPKPQYFWYLRIFVLGYWVEKEQIKTIVERVGEGAVPTHLSPLSNTTHS